MSFSIQIMPNIHYINDVLYRYVKKTTVSKDCILYNVAILQTNMVQK